MAEAGTDGRLGTGGALEAAGTGGLGAEVSIRVCVSTARGFASRFIQWVTRSRVSHALITFRSTTLDKVLVFEATGKGFHLKLWKKWRRHNRLVAAYELAIPLERQLAALRRLAMDLGAEYDSLSLLHFLRRRWGKRLRNPWSSPRKLICSEAVAKFLKLCEIEAFSDPSGFTPADLDTAFAADRDHFRLVEGRLPALPQ